MDLNPNGDSELALMMRDMYDQTMLIKKDVMAGEKPDSLPDYSGLYHAEPTEEGKTSGEAYKLYSDAYLNAMKMFHNAEGQYLEESYSAIVESCKTCHRAMCPGPLVRIRKLDL